jgi:hypothetical protein
MPADRHRHVTVPAPFVNAPGKRLEVFPVASWSAHLTWRTDFATTVTSSMLELEAPVTLSATGNGGAPASAGAGRMPETPSGMASARARAATKPAHGVGRAHMEGTVFRTYPLSAVDESA